MKINIVKEKEVYFVGIYDNGMVINTKEKINILTQRDFSIEKIGY